ncbi:MAG: helix-turn-helix transcriptional regulator [Pseudomonadales bacterium]|jgi:DNA-binding CsgD family transcriptional regulator|nr:helix-turn-helix transcriptional regulator [Pseudomonadales bacterium]
MAALPREIRLPPNQEDFSALVHLLYSSVTDPPRLNEFLSQCSLHLGAVSAAVAICELATGRWRYLDFHPGPVDIARVYESHYCEEDPVKAALLRRAPRRFYLGHELCDEQTRGTHPYWTEWFAQMEYSDVCAARIPLGQHYSCHIGFVRDNATERFGQREVAFLDLLLPHLEQALLIHNRLGRLIILADLAQEHLAQTGAGCVILNGDGRINFRNRIAQDLLRDSNALEEKDGTIRITDPQIHLRFSRLLQDCILVSRLSTVMSGGMVAVPRPGALPLSVVVLPYHAVSHTETAIGQGNSAMVLLYDPGRSRMEPPGILRELYRLSDAEARLSWRLANGETLEEIATAEGSSRETVRSQLKRIFAKTGTSRQAELVRLILIGPALWAQVPARLQPPV